MLSRSKHLPSSHSEFRYRNGASERTTLLAPDKNLVNEVEIRAGHHREWQAVEIGGARKFIYSGGTDSKVSIVVERLPEGLFDVTYRGPDHRNGRKYSDMIREDRNLPPSARISSKLAEDLYTFLNQQFTKRAPSLEGESLPPLE